MEHGHIEAIYNLGICYYNGEGVTQNLEEAIRLFQKAEENGHEEAKILLQKLLVRSSMRKSII